MAFCLVAEHVPQTMIFSSVDEIETITQYPDSLYTDQGWFNSLSGTYMIYYLELLYESKGDEVDVFCYYIKYKDNLSVDDMINTFKAESTVTVAEPNHYCQFYHDPLIDNQWSLPVIGMDQVWDDYSYYGNDIIVGVVDSGVDLGLNDPNAEFYGQIHPDLEENLYTDAYGYHGFNAYAYEDIIQNQYICQDQLGHVHIPPFSKQGIINC